jgi:holin-like protein
MIPALARLVGLLVLCETLAAALSLPVPGAVLGLLALASLFAATGGPDRATATAFDAISRYVPLCFVPAAVGVVASLDALRQIWLLAALAVVPGTAVTLIVVGRIAQAVLGPARSGARP